MNCQFAIKSKVLIASVQCAMTFVILLFAIANAAVFASDATVYRSSNKRVFCQRLGAETVTAVVVVDKVRHPGLFISSLSANGLLRQLRIPAGSVLLTLDGYSMHTAEIADKWLKQRPKKALNYTYALSKNGKTTIVAGRLENLGADSAVTGQGQASGQAQASRQAAAQFSIDELESYCITLINDSRRQSGLPRLAQDSSLSRLARKYADYMLARPEHFVRPRSSPHRDLEGRLPMQRAREAGINSEVHENLGRESRSFADDKSLVARQHNIMMSEPPGQHNHRAIILDPGAQQVGVGIARDGANLYLVEEFGH